MPVNMSPTKCTPRYILEKQFINAQIVTIIPNLKSLINHIRNTTIPKEFAACPEKKPNCPPL